VFEIAEQADRRAVVQKLSIGGGAASLALLVCASVAFKKLTAESAAQGVRLQWTPTATGKVVSFGVGGALIAGALAAVLTNDLRAATWAAATGGLIGAAVGGAHIVRAASVAPASFGSAAR
jgi:hypothetical protein